MTKERAHALIKSKGKVITKPGVYESYVTSCNDYKQVYASGATKIAIANICLHTEYTREEAFTLFRQGMFQAAANKCLTTSIFEGGYRPEAGEMVIVTVDNVNLRAKDGRPATTALMIKKIRACPPIKMEMESDEEFEAALSGKIVEEPSMVADQIEILIPAGVGVE